MWTPELRQQALQAQWGDSFGCWKGIEILKHPNDLLSIQEIIHDTDVELVVETGTWKGGSAHYYADLGVDVISVDKSPAKPPPPHPRVEYRNGYSISPTNLYFIGEAAKEKRTMVLLDSDHSKQNVLAELDGYHEFVTPGCYLVVEDTALDTWLESVHWPDDGPDAALQEWLPDHPEFVVDEHRERFGPTMNPGGYLLKC
jgi:cephalosporin hydroxylase